jgi:hypothetical protein
MAYHSCGLLSSPTKEFDMQKKQKNALTASQAEPSFVSICFNAEPGPVRVLVPDGAGVHYFPYYFDDADRYFVLVSVDGFPVGLHCGERTGNVITFTRESDAVRLCRTRNAAWRGRAARSVLRDRR